MSASCSLVIPSFGSAGAPVRIVTLEKAQSRKRRNRKPARAR
jgi:hypothetical protein